jgi:release factor glutamine methyltransferase
LPAYSQTLKTKTIKMEQKQLFNHWFEILEKNIIILPDKSEENADNTLRALWQLAHGVKVSPIVAEKLDLPILNSAQIVILEELIHSRLSGVPLAHLTERQHFMGLDYILNQGLYIPRKETELLAQTAIETISANFASQTNINVLDLCTGIGTVALAIAHYCSNTRVFGSDIYEPAIGSAKINAHHFHLENRTSFYHADLFEPFENSDLKAKTVIIVCNPPYISSAKVKEMKSEIANYENEEAFDAGPFGLSIFNKLISLAPEYLQVNGYLIFECGLGQGEFLINRITKNKQYGDVIPFCDASGNIRVIKAKKVC